MSVYVDFPYLEAQFSQNKCSPLAPGSENFSKDIYEAWSYGGIVFLTIPPFLSLVALLIYGECIHYIFKKSNSHHLRNNLIWLLGIQPAIIVLGTIAVFMPRSLVYLMFMYNIYVAFAIYKFYYLIMEFAGHQSAFVEKTKGKQITLNHAPCCCLVCLPNLTNSRKATKIAKLLILQNALLTPLYCALGVLLKSDLKLYSRTGVSPATVLSSLSSISTLICMYGFNIFAKFAKQIEGMEALHAVKGKTICIQLTIFITGFESLFFQIMAQNGVFPCEKPLQFNSRVVVIINYAVICQCFLLFLLQRKFYRRQDDIVRQVTLTDDTSIIADDVYPSHDEALEVSVKSNSFSSNHSLDPISNHNSMKNDYGSVIASETPRIALPELDDQPSSV